MSTAARNAEITRRRLAGERPTDLAAEFGITSERIWQIVQAEQRRQRGESSKKRSRSAPTAAPGVIRPRLRLWADRPAGSEWWECVSAMRIGVGATKPEAYARWLSTGSTAAAETPSAGAGIDTSNTSTSTSSASSSCASSTPAPAPDVPALTPVHASQVQVLPGAVVRKPLSFASRLGLNFERVGEAQPPVQSLAGARSPRNGGFHDQE